MTITHRVARLFRADLHALIDRLEEPDVLLNGAVREMEAAHSENLHALQNTERRRSAVNAQIEDLHQQLHKLSSELDVCLSASNDELARSVIRRRLQAEKNLAQQSQELGRLDDETGRMQDALSREAQAIQAIREKQSLLDSSPDQPCVDADLSVSPDEVEVCLLREKQARGQAGAAT